MVDPVIIGDATLYLGDCREILPRLGKVDAVVTDPPYNAGKDYGTHDDDMSDVEYADWCRSVVAAASRIADNQFWVAPRYQLGLWMRLLSGSHLVIIRRGAGGPYRGGWSDQFQIALAIGKPRSCFPDLWDDIRLKGEGYFFRENDFGHPGYTPLPIMRRAVELLSEHSACDPFTMGSGTTGVACAQLGRKFIGIEIEPKYFDIACKRIEEANRQGDLIRDVLPKPTQRALSLDASAAR